MEEMDDELFFEITDGGNYLRVFVIDYKYPDAKLDWDKNWVNAQVEIKAGAFKGNFTAELMTIVFETLKGHLEYMYNNLKGDFGYRTRGDYLEFRITGDGIGHVAINCLASDNPGYMARTLDFDLNIDQTQLMPIVKQLNAITSEFPVIGDLFGEQNL